MSASEPQKGPPADGSRRKVCACCGELFLCGAPAGPCWCDEVKLNAGTLADLRVRFADCLCPGCLPAAQNTKFGS
ncbi:MAG: cysteine-rich CWC family protein [Candidatus Acidiferrales bacterium]